ncbi:hypothetical protein BX600DRAFT_171459 [Xylariales sp. PMI_506]|nr:hypothetical protein BX600DRAFT_171459 [Xylariales sp. PMI_506]
MGFESNSRTLVGPIRSIIKVQPRVFLRLVASIGGWLAATRFDCDIRRNLSQPMPVQGNAIILAILFRPNSHTVNDNNLASVGKDNTTSDKTNLWRVLRTFGEINSPLDESSSTAVLLIPLLFTNSITWISCNLRSLFVTIALPITRTFLSKWVILFSSPWQPIAESMD